MFASSSGPRLSDLRGLESERLRRPSHSRTKAVCFRIADDGTAGLSLIDFRAAFCEISLYLSSSAMPLVKALTMRPSMLAMVANQRNEVSLHSLLSV